MLKYKYLINGILHNEKVAIPIQADSMDKAVDAVKKVFVDIEIIDKYRIMDSLQAH